MAWWLAWWLCWSCFPPAPPDASGGRETAPSPPVDPNLDGLTKAPPANLGPQHPGLFRPLPSAPLTESQRAEIARLEGLGYVDGASAPPARSGVIHHDSNRAAPGLNLWTSGHAPEAYLMRNDGTVMHTWRRAFQEVWPGERKRGRRRGTRYWRHVHLLPGGDLLAIFEGHGLVKLAKDSSVRWSLLERVHHDLHVHEDGRIWVLARRGRVLPAYHPESPVLEDVVLELDPDGNVRREWSVLEAMEQSPHRGWITDGEVLRADLLHTNTLHVLAPTNAPVPEAFQPGRILLSFRTIHAIAVLDPTTGAIVWAKRGPWRGQHDPSLLPTGRLLLFDNFGADGASAVRELDPHTMTEVWSYRGSAEAPFSSPFFGAAARLPNGHTLITDSWVGRALEITPEGEIVWEFLNPHRAGPNQEYIAVLPVLQRLAQDQAAFATER